MTWIAIAIDNPHQYPAKRKDVCVCARVCLCVCVRACVRVRVRVFAARPPQLG